MFCQNCGKQIPENVKFCNHCGAAQVTSSAQNYQQKQTVGTQHSSHQQVSEKAFKSYIAPNILRNTLIVTAVLAIASLATLPPVGIGFAFVAVMIGIVLLSRSSKIKKRISKMQANGTYDRMLQEFATASSMLNDKVRYSENYIFGKNSCNFLSYKEIYWLYRHNMRYLFIPVRSDAMIGDNNGKVLPFCKLKPMGNAGGEEIKALAALVIKKNPHVLLGFDAAKQAEYKRRTK